MSGGEMVGGKVPEHGTKEEGDSSRKKNVQ